jgi:prevent-host-death family protein
MNFSRLLKEPAPAIFFEEQYLVVRFPFDGWLRAPHCPFEQAMKTRVMSATEFKAKCLALLDEIEQRAEPITITGRGVPVAVLGPLKSSGWKSPKNSLAGKARIVGDIVTGTRSCGKSSAKK